MYAYATRFVTIAKFLKTIKGKLFAENYDFRNSHVQIGKDMAYQLFAKATLIDMEYTASEFIKRKDGAWRVIHST